MHTLYFKIKGWADYFLHRINCLKHYNMTLVKKKIKRVSSLDELEISGIEYVSFYNKKEIFSIAVVDQIKHDSSFNSINNIPYTHAFVNMHNGEFIIVDINMTA